MDMRQQAAATLLDKGIKVRVTAPLCFRLFGKKFIDLVISAPTAGTINRINDFFLATGTTPEQLEKLDDMDAHLMYQKYSMVLCRIAAVAWLNSRVAGKLLVRPVARWLFWHTTIPQLITMIKVVVMMMVKEGFTNTIRSAATIQMTEPNLSQINQGS